VIRQGEIGSSFFVLATGRVKVVRHLDDGREVVLSSLSEGAFFGEMALLQDGARTASVIAEEPSQLFEIKRGVLEKLIAEHPSVERTLKNFYSQRVLETIIATHPLFRPFEAIERRALAEKWQYISVNAGDVLIEERAKGDGLYLVATGSLEVLRASPPGGPRLLAELKAGDLFGEMSLLDNQPTIATVQACSETTVLKLPKADFDVLIMTHPQVLELVAELRASRAIQNVALLGAGDPRPEDGAALV
jgi:CRP-like cAMP-binding protein